MESIRNRFFFVVAHVAEKLYPKSCQLVASHMCSRVWGNSDIGEANRTSLDTGRIAGMGFRRNQENPKLVELLFAPNTNQGVFFWFVWCVLDSHQKKHNLSQYSRSQHIYHHVSLPLECFCARNYRKNPRGWKMTFCLRSVCAFVVLDVERKVGLVGDTSTLRWRFVGNLKILGCPRKLVNG